MRFSALAIAERSTFSTDGAMRLLVGAQNVDRVARPSGRGSGRSPAAPSAATFECIWLLLSLPYLSSIDAGFAVFSGAALAACPLNVRVGENSPSLCPTMFSVTYTGMNFLPLCTASVWPMNSGRIVERRDHVRTTFFSFFSFIASTFFIRWSSTNGPFASERPMCFRLSLLRLPRHDPLIRALVVARLEAARRLAPRRHRMPSAASFAFAAAVRVIDRIHRDAAIVRHACPSSACVRPCPG